MSNIFNMKDMEYLQKLDYGDDLYHQLYDSLLQCLRENHVFIVFVKANGEIREMHATRNKDYIEQHYEGSAEPRTPEKQIIEKDKMNRLVRVFDMEKNDFRSFKIDRVKSIEVL